MREQKILHWMRLRENLFFPTKKAGYIFRAQATRPCLVYRLAEKDSYQ